MKVLAENPLWAKRCLKDDFIGAHRVLMSTAGQFCEQCGILRYPEMAEPLGATGTAGAAHAAVLPQADAERKEGAMYRGLLGYFPAALFRVAQHSVVSDRKHNPDATDGPHWARGKSSDHLDCIVRHLAEMHADPDYHLRALAWRALAALQEHEERQGAAPGARSQ